MNELYTALDIVPANGYASEATTSQGSVYIPVVGFDSIAFFFRIGSISGATEKEINIRVNWRSPETSAIGFANFNLVVQEQGALVIDVSAPIVPAGNSEVDIGISLFTIVDVEILGAVAARYRRRDTTTPQFDPDTAVVWFSSPSLAESDVPPTFTLPQGIMPPSP